MLGVRGLPVIAKNFRLSESPATQKARSFLANCLARGKSIGPHISRPISSNFKGSVCSNISASGKIGVGEGGFGSVKLGAYKVSWGSLSSSKNLTANTFHVVVPAAVKTPWAHPDAALAMEQELKVLYASAQTPHPNLQRLLYVAPNEIATPLAITDLHEYINLPTAKPMPFGEKIKLVRQAGEGLAHLHTLGFLHLDLKPQNILINAAGSAVLSDLGGNTAASIKESGYTGFTFPEMLEQFEERTDVYGFSAMLFEMLTEKKLPILDSSVSLNHLFSSLDENKLSQTLYGSLGWSPSLCGPVRKNFVKSVVKSLNIDVTQRPPLSDLIDSMKALEGVIPYSK